ncbi:acyl-ACP thioesterase [Weissella oryzae SG25]|uniref:Acyl-ACP thioesterase n=1 Tax=Weissella oryzae (strain DSM 25784 / JCM 18191 / LMG 30913 / SG25) TaxID=1329250 RepID=A0A069CRK0_WEIOS|nr:acyl-ACP thioesterase domain-containing protein [Weissella oryzae]GAK29992.1 acyl-ACP thioesterase [Weissella oryzae SG25]
MAEMYSMNHEVVYYEADVTGKLSLPMIFNLVVLSSTKQSIDLGVGPEFTHAEGLGWIILQEDMKINRRPKDGEQVILQTMAKEFNPFFAKRLYRILDQAGNILVDVDAFYTMVDMEKRKVARIPQSMVDAYQAEQVKRIPRLADPAKITPDMEIDRVQEYAVRFSDIDSNRHVNNSKYPDWMQDVLGADFISQHEPVAIKIKYEQEIRLGEFVRSEVKIIGNTTLHRIWANDAISAETEITWQPATN